MRKSTSAGDVQLKGRMALGKYSFLKSPRFICRLLVAQTSDSWKSAQTDMPTSRKRG
jgi:hypothetical protein